MREVHLGRYREGYRPTRAERRELEESYRDLFPELVPLFTRRELVRVIDRLRRASRQERRRYELTDYHWLVLYSCLRLYCDLHNDGAIGAGDEVGRFWRRSESTPCASSQYAWVLCRHLFRPARECRHRGEPAIPD